jgi:predicted dehydrogenase
MSTNEKTLRVAIIGAGIGRAHLSGYKKCANVEIAAICDLNEERAKATAEEFGAKHVYTDYVQMLKEATIDAVSVCTPNALHAEIATAALEAGKHVICEKPMADSLAGAEKIVDAARKAQAKGQIFMMGMNNRFRGDSQVLKKLIDAGELGDIYFAKCGWIRRNGIPGFGGWFTTKAMSGGGPLIDIGVHVMDLTMYLMGNPTPVSASGSTYAKFGPRGLGQSTWGAPAEGEKKYDVEDLATGLVKFDNGATLFIEASWASHIKDDFFYSTLLGTEGGAELEPLTVYKAIQGVPADIHPKVPSGIPGGHEGEIIHFVECIREGKQPIPTAEQGLHVLQILDAIYRSAQTGREVIIERH